MTRPGPRCPAGFLALILVLAAFARAHPAPGIGQVDDGLSLARAVEIALARHPSVLVAEAEIRAAAARRLQASARPDPSLVLAAGGVPMGFRTHKERDVEFSLGLEGALEVPGRRSLRVDIGRLGEELAALELDRIRMSLAAEVKKAYYRARLADSAMASLERSDALLEPIIDSLRARYQAGQAEYADLLRIRAEKARLQNRILEERREARRARLDLGLLLGGDLEIPGRLTSDWEFTPFDRTVDDFKQAALLSRPSLKIAVIRAEQAAGEVRLAGLNRKPELSAGLYLPGKYFGGWGFSLGLALPLSKARTEGERAEAAAGLEATVHSVAAAERRITSRIEAVYEELKTAEAQVGIYGRELLAGLEDELGIALERFRTGALPAYALLDLHRTMTEARLEYQRALYAAAVARADLEIAGEESL